MLRKLNQKDLCHATETLQKGGIVAIPTETVYGLAADASNALAVDKIFAAKGRPTTKALSVLISQINDISNWAKDIPSYAYTLAETYWPGPMTLVLPKQDHVHDALTANTNSIGLRIPDNAMALQVLTQFGSGLAAPSANSSGQISPTTADHVRADLGDKVDLILDGGICSLGIESTIIDCTGPTPKILRNGFLNKQDIENTIGINITQAEQQTEKQLRHPLAYTSLKDINSIIESAENNHCYVVMSRQKPSSHSALLHDTRIPHQGKNYDTTVKTHWILMPKDETSFAHCFYEQLHFAEQILDQHQLGTILCEELDENSFIWRTLAQRLRSLNNNA